MRATELLGLAAFPVAFVATLVGLLILACNGGTIPAPVVPTVDLAVCVLDNYASAQSCRSSSSWVLCVATIANACGTDAAAVERVLASDKKARVADGIVPAP